jgi:hypothetical protein
VSRRRTIYNFQPGDTFYLKSCPEAGEYIITGISPGKQYLITDYGRWEYFFPIGDCVLVVKECREDSTPGEVSE